MRTIFLLSIFILALFAYGCLYESQDQIAGPHTGPCDTTNVTFDRSIQPLLSNNCYSCHSNANALAFGGGVRLEAFDDVRSVVFILYNCVSYAPGFPQMPKVGRKLDDCSIATIAVWMRNGTPK